MFAIRTTLFSAMLFQIVFKTIVTFWGAKNKQNCFSKWAEGFSLFWTEIPLYIYMWSLIKKCENRCRNKHKAQIKLSKVQMCMTDLAWYLLMQWQFWQLIWNGFLESTLRIKTILPLFFFLTFTQLWDSWKIHYLTLELCGTLHKKTYIALIALWLMRYRISCAI